MKHVAFDVIVVGAGIAGTSVAAELSKHSSVVLIERESHPAMHATGRSAATFIPSYRANNPALRLLTRASDNFLKSPPADFSEQALLKARGMLTLLNGVSPQASQRELERMNATLEHSIVELPVAAVKERIPALSDEWSSSGWWESDVHDIDVHALQQGYMRALAKNGGRFLSSQDARPHWKKGAWHVPIDGDIFAAPIIVNAAGAWADEFAASANVKPLGLQPKRRTVILVAPPADHDVENWPLVAAYDGSFYFKPEAGMLLVSPVDEHESPPCDAQPDELDMAYASEFAMQALDGLVIKRIAHSWAGLRTFAHDNTPIVGFDPAVPSFFWCAGQGGHGIQIAPATAKLAAAMIHGDENSTKLKDLGFSAEWVSPSRFL